MPGTQEKTCRLCGQDVSTHADRIKDPQGNYYCAPCYTAASKKAAAPKPATPAPSPQQPASEDDGLLDIKPLPTQQTTRRPQPAAATTAVAEEAPPKSTSVPLPKNCPGCGAIMLPGRKTCIKCNRDVTKMDRLLAHRAAADKDPEKHEVLGNVLGKIIRSVIIVVCVGAVLLIGWGILMVFRPGPLFGDYPTTRVAAIQEFLGDINKGTPKSYEKALLLVSLRERASHNPDELNLFRYKFAAMHDDFLKKYGNDWLSRVKIKPPEIIGQSSFGTDEETPLQVSIDNDTFIISTQVQIPGADAAMDMLQRNNNKSYPEDGKNRFGILDVQGYSVRETRHKTPWGPS